MRILLSAPYQTYAVFKATLEALLPKHTNATVFYVRAIDGEGNPAGIFLQAFLTGEGILVQWAADGAVNVPASFAADFPNAVLIGPPGTPPFNVDG